MNDSCQFDIHNDNVIIVNTLVYNGWSGVNYDHKQFMLVDVADLIIVG